MIPKSLWILGALLAASTGLGSGPTPGLIFAGRVMSSHRSVYSAVDAHRDRAIRFPATPSRSNPSAAAMGAFILRQVMTGHSMSGIMERLSGGRLYIRNMGSSRRTLKLRVSPQTVWFQGAWQFTPVSIPFNQPVSLVLKNHMVIGVVGFRNAYGRVVRHHGMWVAIRPVKSGAGINPGCAVREAAPIIAEIVPQTIWNSRKGNLPPGSLVQYTVYGESGHTQILGGVEDYGRASCTSTAENPSPSLPIFSS